MSFMGLVERLEDCERDGFASRLSYSRVDDSDHARLAMPALGAIVVDGVIVGDGYHESIRRFSLHRGHVARVEAAVERETRAVECPLDDGMVLDVLGIRSMLMAQQTARFRGAQPFI